MNFKSISKRFISVVLAVLMLLSCGVVNIVAATIELAETGARTNFYLAGSMNRWSTTANKMTKATDHNGHTIYYSGPWSGNHTFKVVIDGGWWGYTNNVDNGLYSHGVTISQASSDDNCSISGNGYYIVFNDYHADITATTSLPIPYESGTTVYLDVRNNTSWRTADSSGKMYVQLNESKNGSTTNRVEMTRIGENLYSYTFTSKQNYGIRFWRGNSSSMWNYTIPINSTMGNGVLLPDSNSWSGSGDAKTFSITSLATPSLTVSPTTVNEKETVSLSSTVSSLNLNYKIGSAAYTTKAQDLKYTFKYDSTNIITDSTSNSCTWTPTTAGTYSTTVTVSCNAGLSATSASKTVTVQSANVDVSFKGFDNANLGTYNVAIGSEVTVPTPPEVTGYTFSHWEPAISGTTVTAPEGGATYTAVYTPNTYTVTFKFENGQPDAEYPVTYNSTLSELPAQPTKESTAQYSYSFRYWSVDGGSYGQAQLASLKFTKDTTVTAVYNESTRSYDITFNYYEGLVEKTTTKSVKYGEVPSFTAPERTGYTFKGWTPELAAVTGEATYTATYEINRYEIIFEDWDGTLLKRNIIEYGGTPEPPADPSREGYTFTGWDVTPGTVTGDATYTATYQIITFSVAANNATGGTAEANKTSVNYGGNVTFTATADRGYKFKQWSIVGAYDESATIDLTQPSITITPKANITVAPVFEALPQYTITAVVNPDGAGSVEAPDFVYQGENATLTASENAGYVFTGWSSEDVEIANPQNKTITITPAKSVTVTANYKVIEGTVNFSATFGGEVTNNGANSATYFNTVSSTATATETGFKFTVWSVVPGTGFTTSDYKVTITNNNITVQPLKEGVVVNVTANFADNQSIKMYTFTENGLKELTVKENDGTTTQTAHQVTQTPIVFGNETWYNAGDVNLTAGYDQLITLDIFGDSPIVSGTNLIMFENTLGWENVWIYLTNDNLWKTQYNGADDNGCTTVNLTAKKMTRLGSTNYYYYYADAAYSNVLFTRDNNSNYGRIHNNEAVWVYGFNSAKPLVTPTTVNRENLNSTKYYNHTMNAKPSATTSYTGIDITDILYPNGEWCDEKEVWIYIDDASKTATGTFRRELYNLIYRSDVKNAYNNGVNIGGYSAETYNPFAEDYAEAIDALGTGNKTQAEINTAYEELKRTFEALDYDSSFTITGSHGAMPSVGNYFGKISFPELNATTHNDANIGDNNDGCEYITATAERNTDVIINTTVLVDGYVVYGWVINGKEFIQATQVSRATGLFEGTFRCTGAATVIPVYFKATTVAEGSDAIIVYAKMDPDSSTWTNYIAAYTWTKGENDTADYTNYEQFGRWTGQIMIPDAMEEGTFYTFVERNDGAGHNVKGITFNNYGGNNPINNNTSYQAYDYFEFVKMAEDNYEKILFTFNESDANSNRPVADEALDLDDNNYVFAPFVDFSGNMLGIDREKLTEEDKAKPTGLYIVRTGPVGASAGAGTGSETLSGDSYIDCYVYDSEGNFKVYCKSYELLDLDTLYTQRGVDLRGYAGQPVMVDYATLNKGRYDGEWYDGAVNVDISVQVAFRGNNGEITFFNTSETPNDISYVGKALVNNKQTDSILVGSEGNVLSATANKGNIFLGWYKAEFSEEDGSISIDTNKVVMEVTSGSFSPSADATYIALFEEQPADTFIVNNFYYNWTDFAGLTISPNAPIVQGGESSYSNRYVSIKKVYDNIEGELDTPIELDKTETSLTIGEITPGDKLEITIYTKPRLTRDYVYAWYIRTDDAEGVNFEEIGTEREFTSADAYQEQKFTFTHTVKADESQLTIYSDVVHVQPKVTLTYIYNNREGKETKYIVKHTLTGDELNDYKPSDATIRTKAPVVDDVFKDIEWNVADVSVDGSVYTLVATENTEYTVILNVNGKTDFRTGKYNTPVDVYADEIDTTLKSRKGIWFTDANDDGKYNPADGDEVLSYGVYYGLVITGNATLYYTNNVELVFDIILKEAVYGREQSTDEEGNILTDKVYVDYLITYLIPYFDEDILNDVELDDPVNHNTPVRLETLQQAGYTVDYGIVLELINTFSKDESANKVNMDTHFGTNITNTAKIETFINSMVAGDKSTANSGDTGYSGVTHFYGYRSKAMGMEVSNKNRLLLTFVYNNTEGNRDRYYNAMSYLALTKDGVTTYYFSNQQTLNIKEIGTATYGVPNS